MPTHRYNTMKRLENVIRIREYVSKSRYEEDNEIPVSFSMVHENHIAIRDLPEYLITANITEFSTEDEMEFLISMYP